MIYPPYVSQLILMRQGAPWYLRLTRAMFGFNRVLVQQEQWITSEYEKGASLITTLQKAAHNTTTHASHYSAFQQWIQGIDEAVNWYCAVAECAERELEQKMLRKKSKDIAQELSMLPPIHINAVRWRFNLWSRKKCKQKPSSWAHISRFLPFFHQQAVNEELKSLQEPYKSPDTPHSQSHQISTMSRP